MTTTGPLFVRSFNPVWFFVDLVGEPCNDTFYLWVLQNTLPYLPAAVYHTPTGTPWTNPIQLLANGTLPLDVYWDNEQTYRLELRHNIGPLPPSQADPLIYLVENYIPGEVGSNPITVGGTFTDNQVTNPQFADMNVISPYFLTGVVNPPPIEIAPGWFIDLVGNGGLTVEQVPLNNSLANPTNAPYALRIQLTAGWTGVPVLRQRLQQNGMLWANKYVSVSFTALISGAPQQVTARLDASDGSPLQVLTTATLSNTFTQYNGNALLPATMNADIPPDAWIDFKMLLPSVCEIYITSFQLVASDDAVNVSYEQETVDRQIDHTFHYYSSRLQFKPIPSYLVGWDFPVNPAQIFGDTVAVQAVGANKSFYAWDQTILFQSANSGVSVSRGTHGGFKTTAAQIGQFAVIQYLDQAQARKLLQQNISVNLNGFGSIAAGSVEASISLWYTKDANLPSVAAGTNDTFIATLNTGTGRPATFTGGFTWVEITRDNLQRADFSFPDAETFNIGFNGWSIDNGIPADANLATFFAIVVGFAPLAANDYIELNSVSLVSGDIPTIPAPKTYAETLNDCQYFYEKSYASGVVPTTVTNNNIIVKSQGAYLEGGVAYHMVAESFSLDYKTIKRTATPTVRLYNPATGTIDSVQGSVFGSGSAAAGVGNIATTIWSTTINNKATFFNLTTYNAAVVEGSFAGGGWASGAIRLHYVVDGRLGIAN